MNEKIKEILNNLRYTAKEHTIQVLENGGMIEYCPQQIPTEMRLNSYSAKILLDYITNLQKKYENAVSDYEFEHYKNKKAIEKLIYMSTDVYTDNYDIRYKHYNLLMNILDGSDENETNS